MNSTIAHIFAAVMALAVITFPTPNEMFEVVSEVFDLKDQPKQTALTAIAPAERADFMSAGVQLSQAVQEQTDASYGLSSCAYYLERSTTDQHLETCRDLIQTMLDSRDDWKELIGQDPLDPIAEQLLFAMHQFCRFEWTKGSIDEESLRLCRDATLGLAPS